MNFEEKIWSAGVHRRHVMRMFYLNWQIANWQNKRGPSGVLLLGPQKDHKMLVVELRNARPWHRSELAVLDAWWEHGSRTVMMKLEKKFPHLEVRTMEAIKSKVARLRKVKMNKKRLAVTRPPYGPDARSEKRFQRAHLQLDPADLAEIRRRVGMSPGGVSYFIRQAIKKELRRTGKFGA